MKVVINDKIWCELKTNESVCHYKLYPKNVPTEYGGDSRECISGYVDCESPEAAKKCMRSIKELIEGGYKKNPNWLFSLDMGDIMNHILPGKMRMFLNTSADILKNVDKAKALKEKTENSSIIFLAITLPPSDEYLLNDCEKFLEMFSSNDKGEMWVQLSLSEDGSAEIDLWYE